MDEFVTAADANRHFSHLLRGVRDGLSYIVTSHGRPIARLGPTTDSESGTAHARAALLSRLEGQRIAKVDRWTRDELYQDEP